MFKPLLDPHNILVFLIIIFLGVGWLIGRLDTGIVLPVMLSVGGIGVGASVFSTGLSTGVPLTSTAKAAPAASEQVVHS